MLLDALVLPFRYGLAILCTLGCLVVGTLLAPFPGTTRPLLFIGERIWSPFMLWCAGADVSVSGALDEIPRGRGYVIVSNHQGYLDIPAGWHGLRIPIRFVAKKELFFIPFFGLYMWRFGCPMVDRSNRERAVASMAKAGRRIREEQIPILVYAEGTRTSDGNVAPFKRGAFAVAIEAQVPVVPVRIDGSYTVKNRHSFAIRPGRIHLTVGEPISTEGMSGEDRGSLANQVHDVIARQLAPDDHSATVK